MNIGIDLGTSYSSVAAEENGKIEMIRVSTGASAFGDSFSMPTAVYMDNGHILLGQAALNKRKLSTSCFKSEFKRELGTSTPYIIGGEEYLPEQLYTEFFLYFKKQAVEQTGEKIEKVYITHPANYGNNKKRLIEKAANNAGLFDVVLVDEPTAAAAGYAQKNKIMDGDILLVYDLGGGTFDVAIIKKTMNGYVHLTEPLGISMCGGVDFDRAIFDDIMSKLSQNGDFDMDRLMKEKRFTAVLSETSIQIKHQLSHTESHTEPIAIGGFDYFDYTITRQEFENLIRSLVTNTCEKVKDILKNSGLVASDIDRVLLVGGSSRIPLVRKMVKETLHKDISLDADPELAVCRGAVSTGTEWGKEDTLRSRGEKEQYQNIKGNQLHEAGSKALDLNEMKLKKQQIQRFVEIVGNFKAERADKQIQKFIGTVKCLKDKKSEELEDEITQYPESIKELMIDVKFGIYPSDGDWIYYLDKDALFKIKKDGTQRKLLSNRKVWINPIEIDEEWVYYLEDDDKWYSEGGFGLYKIRKDGTEETKIGREKIYLTFAVSGKWIYFTTESYLKKMHIDGTATTILDYENYSSIKVMDDWIYCANDLGVYKMHTDGTGKTNIIKGNVSIDVSGNWIFYKDDDLGKGIFKIRTDGTGKYKICDDKVGSFNVCKRWIYYKNLDNHKYYRINVDGGNPEVIS